MDPPPLEIARFKRDLDAIDEELHVQMQATNDFKSQILMTSDNLKNATEEESKCVTAIIRLESQLHSVAILTDRSHQYLLQEKCKLQNIEEALRHATSEIRDEREQFISDCKLFQKHVDDVTKERHKLLMEKDNLLKKIIQLTGDVDSMEASHALMLNRKRSYNEELVHENKGLEELVQKSERNILEIENQIDTLKDLQAVNDRLLGEIRDNGEAIRQLKDLVVGLEIQLSLLK